jgi:methionyl-tRNA formyltransferase
MNIVYFGNDLFINCLQRLKKSNHPIIRVYSVKSQDEYISHKQIEDFVVKENVEILWEAPSMEDMQQLSWQCDLFIAAGYAYKIPLPPEVTYAVNIHPSLLPQGKGPWPWPHVILNGLKQTGVTIHKLASSFDAGDIILQEAFSVGCKDNLESLTARSQVTAENLLLKLLEDILGHWEKATEQISGSYWKQPTIKQRTFHPKMTVDEIDRIVRAFGKFNAYTIIHGVLYAVNDVCVWQSLHGHVPGTLIVCNEKEMVLAAKDGYVCMRYFRRMSK